MRRVSSEDTMHCMPYAVCYDGPSYFNGHFKYLLLVNLLIFANDESNLTIESSIIHMSSLRNVRHRFDDRSLFSKNFRINKRLFLLDNYLEVLLFLLRHKKLIYFPYKTCEEIDILRPLFRRNALYKRFRY